MSTEPLSIARQGYFFVGGRYEDTGSGRVMSGQMYVEYQIPARQTFPHPVVMIHGGSQTGTNWTGTPDGREGWAQYFLRRGYAVYVVDTVGRGRAAGNYEGWGELSPPRLPWTEERFVAPERVMSWPQAALHTQWLGEGKPGDPHFDQFYASQVSSITEFPRQQALNAAAGAGLIDKIGEAVLVVHSQAGTFGWLIADRRPGKIKAIVAVEPNGPPVHDIDFQGAPTWFKDHPVTKAGGVCHLPLTYDPPLKEGEQLAFVCEKEPQGEGLVRCWRQAEPARKLKHIAGVPVLILQGEASYHAPYDHCTAQYLEQAGVANTFVRLADRGIHGNGHMMMIERNSDEIAAVVEGWLRERLGAI